MRKITLKIISIGSGLGFGSIRLESSQFTIGRITAALPVNVDRHRASKTSFKWTPKGLYVLYVEFVFIIVDLFRPLIWAKVEPPDRVHSLFLKTPHYSLSPASLNSSLYFCFSKNCQCYYFYTMWVNHGLSFWCIINIATIQ